MNERRLVVHIEEVVVEAPEGADLRALEAEVRAGIADAFARGQCPAFAHDAPLLRATHGGIEGIGGAIAHAAPPQRQP